jgi:hypothetical protein
MPDRDRFDRDLFRGNPFRAHHVEDMYSDLRWGDEPDDSWQVDGPEDMATLGTVAKLYVTNPGRPQKWQWNERNAPFLAVGQSSNILYVVPRRKNGSPAPHIPSEGYRALGRVRRTDYYSTKDGEDGYYYHDHERPYPMLALERDSGVMIIAPARTRGGARSYAVTKEGIVG